MIAAAPTVAASTGEGVQKEGSAKEQSSHANSACRGGLPGTLNSAHPQSDPAAARKSRYRAPFTPLAQIRSPVVAIVTCQNNDMHTISCSPYTVEGHAVNEPQNVTQNSSGEAGAPETCC